MSQYKYYLRDNGAGAPHEIYRGNPTYELFSDSGVERAKKNDTWSGASDEVKPLMNDWRQGNFDTEDDEISEEQAMAYLDEWRTSGRWPGRE